MEKLNYVICKAIDNLGNGQWVFDCNGTLYSNDLSIALDNWENLNLVPGMEFEMDELTLQTSDKVGC